MRPKRYRMYELLFNFVILTLYFLFSANGCILLLNGWTPISVYERTSLADIVISGHVIETYKDVRTSAMTYSAKIKIHKIYKGLEKVRQISPIDTGVYIISNFGDKKLCYADVISGESYIIFLTEYQGRLSAQYDDIFGAAVGFTEYNEDEVVKQIGWGVWSAWGPCSRTCDRGIQLRRRYCGKNNETCSGEGEDRRQCNTFSCSESKDILNIFGIQKYPSGVSRNTRRPTAFNVTSAANLYSPLTNVYPSIFPKDFSVIMTVNITSRRSGYLLTMSDIMGRQRMALKYGKALRFLYYDQNDLPGDQAPVFDVTISDSQWHQLSLSVKNQEVALYLDCGAPIKRVFERSTHSYFSTNLMMSLGPYFARYGKPFEGQIEQLVISPDPSAAAKQCYVQSTVPDHAIKDEGRAISPVLTQKDSSIISGKEHKSSTSTPPKEALTGAAAVEWSSWSPCSTTCGKGTQSRTLYCNNNLVEKCTENTDFGSQSRLCYLAECKGSCNKACKHGGICVSEEQPCKCKQGYSGDLCDIPNCSIPCSNGGRCVGPNECACPAGYSGRACENAVCNRTCRHGGVCIRPNTCSCPRGYRPPLCRPNCKATCHNGGRCVSKNRCKCKRGYSGKDCTVPVCRRGCNNGGTCVAPNRCLCPKGFRGRRCQKVTCRPRCKNRGICIFPDVCKCRRGYFGFRCDQYKCKRACKNGGFCVGPNKCACQPGYSGKWCHIGSCKHTCLNGGKCRNDRCRCRKGYRGKRCESKTCNYEKFIQPYERSFRKLIREDYDTKCGPWSWKTCVKTRIRYELVSKTMYRTSYRCV